MITLILEAVVPAAAFVVGVYIGRKFPTTVDHAIAVIQGAERNAKTTLDKITEHKAS